MGEFDRATGITPLEVVETHADLDQSLVKLPVSAGILPPEFFKHFVRFEVETLVDKVNPSADGFRQRLIRLHGANLP